MTELEDRIVYLNKLYREGRPEVNDEEYDLLLEVLKESQPESFLLQKGVIEEKPKTRDRKLPVKMMSLNKVKTVENLIKWCEKLDLSEEDELIVTPKFDGLSVCTILNTDGLQFITRGDGDTGQDCTPHGKKIIKRDISTLNERVLRGEIIILNQTFKDPVFSKYKNSRNTATGFINGDFDENIPYHKMSIIFYEDLKNDSLNKSESLDLINRDFNFPYIPYLTIKVKDLRSKNALDSLTLIFNGFKEIYPVDGLVIEVNDFKKRRGVESNGNPSYQIAFKPSIFSDVRITKVLDVERNINRWGVLTPTLTIEPTEISGVTVSRVNGINMSYIFDWLLFPGQTISIIRSGEVIPKVISSNGINIPFIEDYSSQKEYEHDYFLRKLKINSLKENNWSYQEFIDDYSICPFCGESLVWDENLINLICQNKECPEVKKQKVVEFFRICEVDNFGETTFSNLYDLGFNSVQKILNISEAELSIIDGFGETSIKSLLKEMELIKNSKISMSQLMHASGYFPGLGEKTLQLILDNWDEKSIETLYLIKGVGEKIAKIYFDNIVSFTEDPQFQNIKVSYIKTIKEEVTDNKFENMVVCCSGFRLTKEQEGVIQRGNGKIVDGVNKNTTLLVLKDIESNSSKTQKAKEFGIKILSKEQFLDLIK